jgi:hypothetical protein
MRRSAIEVEIIFLDVLAVIALTRREVKSPLFQDRIIAIPKSKAEHQKLIAIADSGQAIFATTISLTSSLIMGKKIPR